MPITRELDDLLVRGTAREIEKARARNDAPQADAGCVHCPTCGEDVPVDKWDMAIDESFAYPRGSAGHVLRRGGYCVTKPYREPWWLRALRAIKKWSEA